MKKKNVVIVLLLFVFLITGCQMTEETEPVQLSFVHGWGSSFKNRKNCKKIRNFDGLLFDVGEIRNI